MPAFCKPTWSSTYFVCVCMCNLYSLVSSLCLLAPLQQYLCSSDCTYIGHSATQQTNKEGQGNGVLLLHPPCRMLPWVASPLVLAAASFVVYGWKGVGFLVAQAMLAIFCLETVNYIQHYSLSRKVLPNGRCASWRVAGTQEWVTHSQ